MGWPSYIANRFGLIPLAFVIAILVTFAVLLIRSAKTVRTIAPEIMALAKTFTVLLVANLIFSSGLVPTATILVPPFGIVASGIAFFTVTILYLAEAFDGGDIAQVRALRALNYFGLVDAPEETSVTPSPTKPDPA